jgi:hypothetical protein
MNRPTLQHPTVAERYERDPAFRTLVDHMEVLLSNAQFTGTEIREAAMLATIRHESYTIHRLIVTHRYELLPEYRGGGDWMR